MLSEERKEPDLDLDLEIELAFELDTGPAVDEFDAETTFFSSTGWVWDLDRDKEGSVREAVLERGAVEVVDTLDWVL